jgi:hypothetical protein
MAGRDSKVAAAEERHSLRSVGAEVRRSLREVVAEAARSLRAVVAVVRRSLRAELAEARRSLREVEAQAQRSLRAVVAEARRSPRAVAACRSCIRSRRSPRPPSTRTSSALAIPPPRAIRYRLHPSSILRCCHCVVNGDPDLIDWWVTSSL